ncbi:hypothetical protein SLEP1_g14576 [Rubroshorea leprosula]|uniref:Peptide N-acetyl-beta-D-glucosaminyl asparaginase amidase A N-terminal domain-containing protein n=1 Tax=Rubroshorea leprosula TaxID=152421 RepID=A0AAV5IUZ9_9ROSI|nr:hypothetical protein SLEP1_g14576 [Rubroshorea leprosula]
MSKPLFMASVFLFLLCLLFLLPLSATANLHKSNILLNSSLLSAATTSHLNDTPPTLYFEVAKPIRVPKTQPCVHRILHHDFGYTYGKPPVFANYTPPSHCPSHDFSKIVLEWNATCKGRQYDRIFGAWLSGVELLRSCTAEPRATGIVWSVKKDITRYYSLLLKNETQIFAVYMGNVVDQTYTGVYHVDVTIYFYPAEKKFNDIESNLENLASGYGSRADLILPISRNLPLNDGLWFEIENSTDTKGKEFKVPPNVYRAVLEVYVSFHEDDEFWYANPPNDYLSANNITDTAGNGPFREVVVSLDGYVVGAIWPFTVVYTGGINPLLWRPITGIGSFDLPTYDIEITPFLGTILDGKVHKLGFSVTNALDVWYIDANLHLWLDSKNAHTEGKLLKYQVQPLQISYSSDFKGLNGTFLTKVNRSISSTGWVKSSHGMISTTAIQDLSYSNFMVIGDDGNMEIVNQEIHFNDSVHVKKPYSFSKGKKSNKRFLLYLYSNDLDQGNGTSLSVANVTLGFDAKKFGVTGLGFRRPVSSLKNLQNGQGVMVVKDNLVVSGVGSTQQNYKYDGNKFCYFRNISSSNYTILYDEVGNACNKRIKSFGFWHSSRWIPSQAQGTFLASD